MFDGQFFPGQNIQFVNTGINRPPWYKNTLQEVITRLGLTTNLETCLDAGAGASYTSGQKWLDLSGNGVDFFRGTTSSAQASDPTFNGSADGRSSAEYWSFDGGDSFTHDAANLTWMNNLHKNNAIFSFCAWIYCPSSAAWAITGTGDGSNSIGFLWIQNTSAMQIFCGDGTAPFILDINLNTLPFPSLNTWTFVGMALNEGSATGFGQQNGTQESFTSTYSTPSASNASFTMRIGSLGNGVSPVPSGSRMASIAAWEGTALTTTDMMNIYNATRSRFGV